MPLLRPSRSWRRRTASRCRTSTDTSARRVRPWPRSRSARASPSGNSMHAGRQVAVGVVLAARDHLADQRQHAAEVEAIQPAEQPAARLREFEDRHPAARPGHAHHLGDAAVGVGHVAQAERHRRRSENDRRETAAAGRRPRDSGCGPAAPARRRLAAWRGPASHGRNRRRRSAPAAGRAVVGQGQVAGAGAEVEDGAVAVGRHQPRRPPAPVAIDVQAEQVVEQVVASARCCRTCGGCGSRACRAATWTRRSSTRPAAVRSGQASSDR